MFQADVFRIAVAEEFGPDGPVYNVLQDFAATMLESMIARYSLYSAKGTTDPRFAHNSDQTMLAHLLNGLLPTLKLVHEGQRLGFARLPRLDETALKVYILAYSMHDLDKIISQTLKTKRREDVLTAQSRLVAELELLGAGQFLPDLNRWAGLILWLAVNTQRTWDINLSQTSFIDEELLRLAEGAITGGRLATGLEPLVRNLCTFSDIVAYLLKSPEESLFGQTSYRDDGLNHLLYRITDGGFTLVYHKLNEVRGFLSNLINNAANEYLLTLYEGDLIPFLYFPNGTVYLNPRSGPAPQLDWEEFNRQVRQSIQQACQEKVGQGEGLTFSPLSLLKYPAYFHDFLSPARFLEVVVNKTLRDSKANVAEGTLQKLRDMQGRGQIPADLPLNYTPDERVTMLGRFLINFVRLIEENLPASTKPVLLEKLAAEFEAADWQAARQIPSPGGLEYGYYWLAGCYLQRKPLALTEGESPGSSLEGLMMGLVQAFMEAGGPALEEAPALQGPFLRHLPAYLAQNVVFGLDRQPRLPQQAPAFAEELAKYSAAKKPRENQLPCTICNGVFPSDVQEDAAVLFQPWVYKNRLPLYKGSNAGGICAICSLELMLRQILLTNGKLTGKKFEALELKYFFIYPAFFFTGLTSRLTREMLVNMDDLKLFEVRSVLQRRDRLTATDILNLKFFTLPSYRREDFENDEADLKESRGVTYLLNRANEKQYPGFMFFAKRTYSSSSGAAATTASWVEAAWLGLALPLALGARVVVSEDYLPLFNSAAEFKETVVLDAPHQAVRYLLPAGRLRLDQLYGPMRDRDQENHLGGVNGLAAFSRALEVHIDTEAGQGDLRLGRFNRIAREIATDKLWVFAFLQERVREQKLDSMPLDWAHHYVKIFEELGGDMTRHRQIVELYLDFYSPFSATGGGKYPSSRAIVQPVDIAARRIINDTLNLSDEEIKLETRQELQAWLDRVRRGEATGRVTAHKGDEEMLRVKAFVDAFYKEVFVGYAEGQRSLLASRLNRFKNGCEAAFSDIMWEKRQARQQAGQSTEDLPDPAAPREGEGAVTVEEEAEAVS